MRGRAREERCDVRKMNELNELASGAIPFDVFAQRTAGQWSAMARYLMRRWKVPAGVEQCDIEQELRLAAWSYVPRWDPARGPLIKFVTWNAMTAAKKWMHSQARRRHDGAAGHVDIPVSWCSPETEQRPEPVGDATQEDDFQRLEVLAEILSSLSDLDARVVGALLESRGDIECAAEVLYRDSRVSLALRLGSEADARHHVRRVIKRAARVVSE